MSQEQLNAPMVTSKRQTLCCCINVPNQRLYVSTFLPGGIELRPLIEQCDIRKVSSFWKSDDAKISSNFEKLSKYNRNVGAFNQDGTIASWVFQDQIGLVGRLQTDAIYFRRGYGILVTKQLSKRIAEAGFNVYAGIFESNLPSRNLFTKLGFNLISTIHFIITSNHG